MATEAKTTNYWIASNALYIQLNALNDPDYIQCGVVSGASIICYMRGIKGLEYDAGHNYQRWPIFAYPTKFPDSLKKYVYIAIPRVSVSVSGENYALVCFPSVKVDIYGKALESSAKLGIEEGSQYGNESYYYIFLQGVISSSIADNGDRQNRDWDQIIDTGTLSTDESLIAGGGDAWWRYDSVGDTVSFLKTIFSADFKNINIDNAQINTLLFGGAKLTGVATSDTPDDSNNKIVTPSYIKKYFISKIHNDEAQGFIGFKNGLQVGDYNTENGGSWTPDTDGRSHLVTDYLEVRMKAALRQAFADYIKVGNNFVFDKDSAFAFDKDGNIIAHSISSDNASVNEEKGFILAMKDNETGKYRLCLDELTAWGLATMKQLHVKGGSTFDGDLFSKQFVSGFLGGKGWGVYNKPITNAAGVQENKWTGEFDNLIIRGSLRVYEMIISQLLGENDNRIFTGMMEVDHYDPRTGKVYLDTQDGKLYNPFRRDDIIMVQQYNGMPNSANDYYVTKNYELLVTDAGCGSLDDGEKRLDWVTFTNFTSSMEGATPEKLIAKRDTFVRVDNLTDPDRKGIMQIITVGTAAPYLDVIYGLKTDPDNALKGRLGNLQGIVHPLFGKLQGFGEYLNNLYAVGDFVLRRTGESIDTKFQVLENMFSSRFQKTSYELTNGDNYLENGQFLEQVTDADTPIIKGWDINADDETMIWVDANGLPYMVNSTLTTSGNHKVTLEQNGGRQMLRIQNCGLRQVNSLIRQSDTHIEYIQPEGDKEADTGLSKTDTTSKEVQDTLYVNVQFYAKTAGTLTVGFEGCTAVEGKQNELSAKTYDIAYSGEWDKVKMQGKWNGTGDFVIRYSGDCYIAIVTLTDEPLDSFSKTVSTQILQTATNIQLLGENIDKVNDTTTKLGIDVNAEKKSIRLYVEETAKNTKDSCNEHTDAQIKITKDSITSTAESMKSYTDGSVKNAKSEIKQTTDSISATVAANKQDADGRLSSAESRITQTEKNIKSVVASGATKEELEKNKNTLQGSIESSLQSAKDYTNGVGSDTLKSANAHAESVGRDIRNSYDSTITIVQQNKDSWIVAASGFDKNGKLKDTAGAVLTTQFAGLYASAVAGDGSIQKKAEMNVYVTRNGSNVISNATINADNVNISAAHRMNFTVGTITINAGNFSLDASGNVDMKGNVTATSGILGGFTIGENYLGTRGHMYLTDDALHFGSKGFFTSSDGYYLSFGNYNMYGMEILSYTGSNSSMSTGIHVNVIANSSISDPISGGKMCTALDISSAWASGAGSFDQNNPYQGNHAIVIRGGDVIGLRPSIVRISTGQTLTEYHHTIVCTNTSTITLYLPSSPKQGQCYTIIQRNNGYLNISGSGKKIHCLNENRDYTTWPSQTTGQVSYFWYDGVEWLVRFHTDN